MTSPKKYVNNIGKSYILWMFKLLMRPGETRNSLNACSLSDDPYYITGWWVFFVRIKKKYLAITYWNQMFRSQLCRRTRVILYVRHINCWPPVTLNPLINGLITFLLATSITDSPMAEWWEWTTYMSCLVGGGSAGSGSAQVINIHGFVWENVIVRMTLLFTSKEQSVLLQ